MKCAICGKKIFFWQSKWDFSQEKKCNYLVHEKCVHKVVITPDVSKAWVK